MRSTVSSLPAGRCGRITLIAASLLLCLITWMFWYAANSDQDNIPPIFTQLIPAGHATCASATVFECSSCLEQHFLSSNQSESSPSWTFDYHRDGQNEGLHQEQCEIAFPGLFEDVKQGLFHWKTVGRITKSTLDQVPLQNGMTRAMIHSGNLYILASKSKGEDHRRKILAVLSSMHRALAAAGEERHTLPDIEFIFSIEDKASDITSSNTAPLWVLARKATEKSFFLLPDFGFWAWDNIIEGQNNEIGPYDEVVSQALAVEQDLPFAAKSPQLVWRGKLSFAPKLRRALLDISRDQPWSDVKQINWRNPHTYLSMSDHCTYQFIAHVEGRSYSASLKYRQACNSVLIAHQLQYIQHHHYLLVPSGPHQNYVQVERDFSDLPMKIQELIANPAKAESIASNSVKTFRERYLTMAAEACYWRALWRGYGDVSEAANLWHESVTGEKQRRGRRYETFVLLSSEEMLDFDSALPS
ncbi:glycosyl transferase family 90-domain-containing [Lecanosticta acicola]|uniref:Glycosyl transferase family 90-domain-containing n=1 Tax=Lecanosticta acicola TaxID=111012 RepID=A0AAI9E973_9PEZI|nr:glycosyl transferase family 90-domain-containing [Lecanosticta acicola]